ncbi:DNA-binding MarR family transcriptional regulator [Sagittula marina]|uniref:DNA-binding MarR family transcriptional regulator n=1 Tax=Sagittula marina TaxID=943940 RepID=A0A7W6GU23_9RHOB|nr:MarR family transcriptional regulator [Sagittula marina]MBB3985849.1 DNA-binding MarR family transcriptional regulator [Sagittula marina]
MQQTDDQNTGRPETEPYFSKTDWPFYWITQTSNQYNMVMEQRLKAEGLDITYWRVLMSVYEEPALSVSEIARLCIIKLTTATKIVQRMAAQGLVTTAPRQTDGRVTEVTLTSEGHQLRRKARAVADEIFRAVFDDMSREEKMVMNLLLEKVFHKLGDL